MRERLLYILATNADIAGSVTSYNGEILLNLNNYTEVLTAPEKPARGDLFCFAIKVPETNVKEFTEGNRRVTAVWDGPFPDRVNVGSKVRCKLYSLTNPMGAEVSDELITKMRDQELELAKSKETISALQAKADKAAGEIADLSTKIVSTQERADRAETSAARLRDELVQATSGTVIREMTTKDLANAIKACDDMTIEALPFIGPENKVHLRKWAEQVVG